MSYGGNLVDQLTLICRDCQWDPGPTTVMEAVALHFKVEHDSNQSTLELIPRCACGTIMVKVHERPTGGGVKVYFECPSCEATGWIRSSS